MAQLDASHFAPHGQWSQDEFRSRVRRYEALAEPLTRMAGVLGRWGDGSELTTILDIVRGLYLQAEKVGNDLVVWLGLRSYPAVLIFTAYGVGLTRSQRWKSLHELLVAPWPREYRDPKRVVSTLFLDEWKGTERGVWKELEGLDRHKTPLSDHLFEVMMNWRSSFAGVSAEFELVFERFELLAALAYLEENSEASLEQAFANTPHDLFARMPVGRAGWREASANLLIRELQAEATITALLDAGFARNSRRFLELSIENFKRYVHRMSW